MREPAGTVRAGASADAPCDEDEILETIANEPVFADGWTAAGELRRLPPIYFIGDSRVMPFRNAVYVSEHTARAYQLRSVHLRCLYAVDFYSAERGLNAALVGALATDQAMISHDEGARWSATPWHEGRDAGTAPLVLFCGAYDVHRVMDELGPNADVLAWDDVSRGCDVTSRPASSFATADDVLRRILEIMQPLALGIGALRELGFARIWVHGCYRPRMGENLEARFRDMVWLQEYRPGTFAKVQLLFDRAMRRIAAQTSSRYLAAPVDANGEVAADCTADDVHYNVRGASEVARSVIAVLEGVVE
jgi:hypothetical protein